MKNASRRIETAKATWKQAKFGGVEYIPLNTEAGDKAGSMIVKLAANTQYPKHRHRGVEEIFVLKGTLVIGEQTLRGGDYLFSPAGSMHAMSTVEGCLFHWTVPEGIDVISEGAAENLVSELESPPI